MGRFTNPNHRSGLTFWGSLTNVKLRSRHGSCYNTKPMTKHGCQEEVSARKGKILPGHGNSEPPGPAGRLKQQNNTQKYLCLVQ